MGFPFAFRQPGLLFTFDQRLQAFLGVGKDVVGTIGGGKAKPTGKIDIAVMQSVSRQGEVNPLVETYGQVTVTHAQTHKPVPGAYACGLDAHAIFSGVYPGGGSSIGPAMTYGYIAARDLAGVTGPD